MGQRRHGSSCSWCRCFRTCVGCSCSRPPARASSLISSDITVPDLLIRNLSEAELRQLDSRARALGLSRSEYVRRRLRQDNASKRVTAADLDRFARAYADLADPEVLAGAWH